MSNLLSVLIESRRLFRNLILSGARQFVLRENVPEEHKLPHELRHVVCPQIGVLVEACAILVPLRHHVLHSIHYYLLQLLQLLTVVHVGLIVFHSLFRTKKFSI